MEKIVFKLINKETKRQNDFIQLIASENYVSKNVLKATGSILTNKYAEGYPGARYYGGCEVIDEIEDLARENLKKIFDVKFVNVQPHSGSQANQAAYLALLEPGDKILAMSLNSGGHLTHGYHISSSGKYYQAFHYEVDEKTFLLDYDAILKKAKEVKPKLIVCGASAYSREIDFKKFREIADKVGAFLMADVAHISGLIVAKIHNSPIPHCHVITSTTHKTLRGPRGGIIMTNYEDIAKKIDRAVFPGIQGGPLEHVIGAKAICFEEASTKDFVKYQKQLVSNCKIMEKYFIKNKIDLIAKGTDNHLLLINVKTSFNISGKQAEDLLHKVNIICNKNSIPFDNEKPTISSGIRIGSAAMTTRGFENKHFLKIAEIIFKTLSNPSSKNLIIQKKEVLSLLKDAKKITNL